MNPTERGCPADPICQVCLEDELRAAEREELVKRLLGIARGFESGDVGGCGPPQPELARSVTEAAEALRKEEG